MINFVPRNTEPTSNFFADRYGPRAGDLVRFTPDAADEIIGRFIDDTKTLDTRSLDELRARLTADDMYMLIRFARRAAAESLRERSRPRAVQGAQALTLVDRDRIDFRDLSADFPLYACRQSGEPIDPLVERLVERSTQSTASVFKAALKRIPTVTLADCALLEVNTSYGLGFMERWLGSDDLVDLVQEAELGTRAVRLADRIDADGSYLTTDFAVTGLPGVWFSQERTTHSLPTTACVNVRCAAALTKPYSHALLVFIAQSRTTTEAEQLAARANDAATPTRPRVAVTTGPRLCLIIGGSFTTGEKAHETSVTLNRFADLALTLL
jgi:hypothetical protein